MLPYPKINPNIIEIGSVEVRWYGLMYVLGFLTSYLLIRRQRRAHLLGLEGALHTQERRKFRRSWRGDIQHQPAVNPAGVNAGHPNGLDSLAYPPAFCCLRYIPAGLFVVGTAGEEPGDRFLTLQGAGLQLLGAVGHDAGPGTVRGQLSGYLLSDWCKR